MLPVSKHFDLNSNSDRENYTKSEKKIIKITNGVGIA